MRQNIFIEKKYFNQTVLNIADISKPATSSIFKFYKLR